MSNYPSLIEMLDYEAIRESLLVRARDIAGWTAELESDPVVKLLEIAAYRELALRAHINHVAISNLVQFASGDDLDAAAEFYQIIRLSNESDADFRARLLLHIRGMAGNGTHDSYIARAKAAHPDVIDVTAYRLAPGKVNIAVWGSAAAVAAVAQALTADNVEMLGIDVNVYAAQRTVVDIAATVTVTPNAPLDVADLIAAQFKHLAAAEAGFGRLLAVSQIVAWLHEPLNRTADVVLKATVASPASDISVAADALWQIGTLTLTVDRGRT